jgi:hypothetical protein
VLIAAILVGQRLSTTKPSEDHGTSAPPKSFYVYAPSANKLVLCASEHALAEFTRIAARHDMVGLLAMMSAGDAFGVENGQHVSVIESGALATEVRVVSGQQGGRIGWISTEFVHGGN